MSTTTQTRPYVPVSLLLSAATVTISFGAIFGLLADLQHELGFSNRWLGLVTGGSFAAGFVVQMRFARYADSGHGKRMLRSGIVLCVVGCLAVAVATNLWMLLMGRVVLGIGEGLFLPAARRVVIVRNPDSVGAALGRLGAAQTAGFLVGPPFAAYLAELTTLWAPFVVLALALVAFMPTVFRFNVPTSATANSAPVLRSLLRNPGVRVGIWIGIGLTVSIGVYDSLWARFLKDLGASTKFVGLSLTIFGLPIVLFSGAAGRLADRFGPSKVGALALCGSVPFIAGYAFLHNYWLIACLAFAHSTFDAGVAPSSQSQVAVSVEDHLVAAGQGVLEGIGLLAAAVSAIVAAPLYEVFGAKTVWLSLSAAVVVCAVGATLSQRKSVRDELTTRT